jgi:translation initiation factor 2-alpha kinase 4
MQYKAARRRAQSDATEVPSSGDTLTESFPNEIEFRGVRFNAVKMFHPRKGQLRFIFVSSIEYSPRRGRVSRYDIPCRSVV